MRTCSPTRTCSSGPGTLGFCPGSAKAHWVTFTPGEISVVISWISRVMSWTPRVACESGTVPWLAVT